MRARAAAFASFTYGVRNIRTHCRRRRVTPYSRHMFSQGDPGLMQAAVDAIIVIDHRGRCSRERRRRPHVWLSARRAALGQNVSVLMPEPDRSAHDGYMARYLADRKAQDHRHRARGHGSTQGRHDFSGALSVGRIRNRARRASSASCATFGRTRASAASSWSATAPTPTSSSTIHSADARYRAPHRRNQRARQ